MMMSDDGFVKYMKWLQVSYLGVEETKCVTEHEGGGWGENAWERERERERESRLWKSILVRLFTVVCLCLSVC